MANLWLAFLLSFALLLHSCGSKSTSGDKQDKDTPPITLVVHGGAGDIDRDALSQAQQKLYKQKLKKALNKGYTILDNGGKALDAVEETIRVLERDTFFNAGRGSVLNARGRVSMDAALMKGLNKQAGAVASVGNLRHPITGAKGVLDSSKHVMLVSEGARQFALSYGVEPADSAYLVTHHRAKSYHQSQNESAGNEGAAFQKFGTVGAVALDKQGNLAAGTSTGGLSNKAPGRVGDSPTIGAGTYADNLTCAVSATGQGEFFMRNLIAYDVAARMTYHDQSLGRAAKNLIHTALTEAGGKGGLIALDTAGNFAMPFNTSGMFRAFKQQGDKAKALIFPES